ncbi:hypothetical protein E0H75_11795 [Kribbella capetownensis]|uniref:Acetoacetate decarboxylase n=1 Tax=Kribbella capetownensis TaxID=1572659 RepID=A0A4V2M8B1_9ACTN|nr:hypothetical protein [Kribbella capetownensis]TCC50842.1 hypothetical protein E0H75_11795 [Kribbella capetownensis]
MRRELSIPFDVRGHRGLISVRIVPNDDPWASGHQLVVPDLNAEAFRGFPLCTASLRYHGYGIKAMMGWIQLVTRDFDGDISVDRAPNLNPADPFYTYGYLPTFFDAPANPNHPDGTWRADTFLVIVPDVIRSRTVAPVAAFTWGYRLEAGRPTLLDVTPLASARWSGHRSVLEAAHPTWTFG